MPRLTSPTDKQAKFVEIYLSNGRNATQAFIDSYGTKISQRTNITTRALKTLNSPCVKTLIDAAEKKALTKTMKVMEKYAITEARIKEELAKIAFSDPKDVMTWGPDGVQIKSSDEIGDASASISDVVEIHHKNGKSTKVKQYDKQQALIALGKHIGMFVEKHTHEHKAVNVNFVIEKE